MDFATLLTESYLPGALALGQSLHENSGFDDVALHVLLPEGLSEGGRAALERLPISVHWYGPDWLVEYACSDELIPARKTVNQYKFNAFRLPPEKVVYLDADVLCLGNVEALRDATELSAVVNVGKDDVRYVDDRPVFNAGMFVCEPDADTFAAFQAFGEEWDRELTRGDQPILNEFYLTQRPERVTYLDHHWNVIQSCKRWKPDVWQDAREAGIKFLHYTQIKPWDQVVPRSIADLHYLWSRWPQRFVYREPIAWWRPYYRRATAATG